MIEYHDNLIDFYNIDCLQFLKTVKDNSVDLICTDPPYLCTARGSSGTMGGYWKDDAAKKGTIFSNNDISCQQYLPEFFRILKDGTHCYIMINHINLIEMLNVATNCGFKFIKSLIWDKGSKICGRYYMNCFEYILMFRKGTARDINNCGTPDILNIPINKAKDFNGKNLHDTEKPVRLMEILIENSTNKGQIVFEPFAGIGATVVASRNLQRKCIACELDERYANIAISRLKHQTFLNYEQLNLF